MLPINMFKHTKKANMADEREFDEIIGNILQQYKPGFTLRDFQREVLAYVYNTGGNAIISAPTGAGKSAIFHLVGPIMGQKKLGEYSGSQRFVTLVLAPLNIIQMDQIKTLKKLGISACKLDIGGKAKGYDGNEDEDDDDDDDHDDDDDDDDDADDNDDDRCLPTPQKVQYIHGVQCPLRNSNHHAFMLVAITGYTPFI